MFYFLQISTKSSQFFIAFIVMHILIAMPEIGSFVNSQSNDIIMIIYQKEVLVRRQNDSVCEGELVHEDLAGVGGDVVLQHATARRSHKLVHTVCQCKVGAKKIRC